MTGSIASPVSSSGTSVRASVSLIRPVRVSMSPSLAHSVNARYRHSASDCPLAEHHWQHGEDVLGEEVEVEVVKPLRVTMSFRLPAEEAEAIREAAAAAGTSLACCLFFSLVRVGSRR
jgi:hypothetical protein